jgi:hypothetical protein
MVALEVTFYNLLPNEVRKLIIFLIDLIKMIQLSIESLSHEEPAFSWIEYC